MKSEPQPISLESPSLGPLYDDLRSVASAMMRRERCGHTLQATAVVHEAFMRLSSSGATRNFKEAELLAIASRVIRQVLVDHARERGRMKRTASFHTELERARNLAPLPPQFDIEKLDHALGVLSKVSPRAARIVELRFFGGLPMNVIADIVDCSRSTAQADWTFARASLLHSMTTRERT